MDCPTIQNRMHELLDGRRRPEDDHLVAEHCRSCPACAEQMELLKQLEATVRALPRPEPPEDLPERILHRVRADRTEATATQSGASARRRWDGVVLAAAVALGVLVMVAVDSLWPRPESPLPVVVVEQDQGPLGAGRKDSLAPIKRQLQENLEQLMAETRLDLQQAQALLPEGGSVSIQTPPVGAEVLSPVTELVRPLQPVASDTFSTLGAFWSRVTEVPSQEPSAPEPDPG